MSMVGIALVLDGVVKLIGLGAWYGKNLDRKCMVYYQPENKPSMVDKWVKWQTRRPLGTADKLRVKAADATTKLIRKAVDYEAFRQLVRALFLPHSPLRARLSSLMADARKRART